MQTHVDKFGRVIIPKPIRTHLGLQTGATLTIEEHAQDIVLRPAQEAACVVRKDGVLIFSGAATGELREALRQQREQRLSRLTARLSR